MILNSFTGLMLFTEDVPPEIVVERSGVAPLMFAEFLHHNFMDYLPTQNIDTYADW